MLGDLRLFQLEQKKQTHADGNVKKEKIKQTKVEKIENKNGVREKTNQMAKLLSLWSFFLIVFASSFVFCSQLFCSAFNYIQPQMPMRMNGNVLYKTE